jgi:hypothetical protein
LREIWEREKETRKHNSDINRWKNKTHEISSIIDASIDRVEIRRLWIGIADNSKAKDATEKRKQRISVNTIQWLLNNEYNKKMSKHKNIALLIENVKTSNDRMHPSEIRI